MMKFYQGRKRTRGDPRSYRRSKSRSRSTRPNKRVAQLPVSINRPVVRSGLGNAIFTKLVYCEKVSIGGSLAGITSNYQFRSNGLQDPNYTGSGHQPLGYDQITPLFERYTVTQAEYKITMYNSSSTGSSVVCIWISDAAATTTSMTEIVEQGNARVVMLAPQGSGPNTEKYAGLIKNWVVAGQTYEEYMGDDTNGALVGTNPADTVFLNLSVCDGGSGTSPIVQFFVEITYYVWFKGGVVTAQS